MRPRRNQKRNYILRQTRMKPQNIKQNLQDAAETYLRGKVENSKSRQWKLSSQTT